MTDWKQMEALDAPPPTNTINPDENIDDHYHRHSDAN